MRRNHLIRLAMACAAFSVACSGDPELTTEVRLEILSEIDVDRLEVLVRNEAYLWDRLEQPVEKDLTEDPFLLQLTPGRIDGEFLVYARGYSDDVYVAGQSRVVAYEQDTIVVAQLLMTPDFVSADADEDGFTRCQAGSVAEECDCDDRDGFVNPFTAELCGDDIDNDCSGGYPPDGSGCPCTEDVPCTNLDEAFVASAGLGACTLGVLRCVDGVLSDSCEGASPIRNPGAEAEVPGNFIDDDCDGVVDEGGPCDPVDFPSGRVCHRGFVDDPANNNVADIFSELLDGIAAPGIQASFLARGVCAPEGRAPGRQSCIASTRTWGLECVGDILPQRPPLPRELDEVEPGMSVDIGAFRGVGFVELRLPGVVDLEGNPIDQCDGQDNNCDGLFDESPSFDSDSDGYTRCGTRVRLDGDPPVLIPDQPGLGDEFIDCNDSDPTINPDPMTRELCGDTLDNDCFCDHGLTVGEPRFRVDGAFNCTSEDSVLDCSRAGPRSDPTPVGFRCGDTGDGLPPYYWGYRNRPPEDGGELACYLSNAEYGISCAVDGACGTKDADCTTSGLFPEPGEDRLTETRPLCGDPAEGSCTGAVSAAWDPVGADADTYDDCGGFACTGYFWGVLGGQCFTLRAAEAADVACAGLPFCDGSNPGACCDPSNPASCCQTPETVCERLVPADPSDGTLTASVATQGAPAPRATCTFAAAGCFGVVEPVMSNQGVGIDLFNDCTEAFVCSNEADAPYYAGRVADGGPVRCYLRADVLDNACDGTGECRDRAEACGAQDVRGPPVARTGERICKVATDGCMGTTPPVYGLNVTNFTDPYDDCPSGNCCDGECCRGQGEACGVGVGNCDVGLTCVDGVCCDRNCDGPCEACTAALTANVDGVCSAIDSVRTDTSPNALCVAGGGCAEPPCICDGDPDANGIGACVSDVGGQCSVDSDCAAGNCVDGFCCDGPCAGRCQGCSSALTANADGVCGPIDDTTDPFTEDTFPSNLCANNAGCGSGGLDCACVFDSGTSQCLRGQGSPCATDGECQSDFCVDGFCCESACDGSSGATRCRACAAALTTSSQNGVCAPLLAAGPDVDNSAAGSPTTVCGGGTGCGDSDCLCQALTGQCLSAVGACTSDADCPGVCSLGEGICCNERCDGLCESCLSSLTGLSDDGTCGAITALFPDVAPAPAQCSGAVGCPAGQNCICDPGSPGTCRSDVGTPCGSDDSLCASGHCVDGVCCENGCTDTCFSCNASDTAAASGTCAPINILGAEDTNATAVCSGTRACNGSTANPLCLDEIGQGCSADNECLPGTSAEFFGRAVGFCIDNRCCDGRCDGACEACRSSLTGAANGTCSTRTTAGPDTNGRASGASATCSGTVGCTLGAQCECGAGPLAGQCRSGNGVACGTNGGLCLSTNCVDGFCCNTACGNNCDACDLTPGLCTNQAAGTDGDPSCPANLLCGGGSASCPGGCSGNDGLCAPTFYCCRNGDQCDLDGVSENSCTDERGNGQACQRNAECSSGNCIEGVCCDSGCGGDCESCLAALTTATNDGSCLPILDGGEGLSGPTGCPGNYLCDGSSSDCPTSCTTDADCDMSHFCEVDNTCRIKLGPGASCTVGNECESGFCTDNVCCTTACNGTCNACDSLGKTGSSGVEDGFCGAILAGTDPAGECGNYFCTGGPDSASAACDTTCESNDDSQCKSGTYCQAVSGSNNDRCDPPQSNGNACEGDRDCVSDECWDDTCCNAGCGGTCRNCSSGSCTTYAAGTDPELECGNYVCAAGGVCFADCEVNDDNKCGGDRFCDSALDPDQCVGLGVAGDACEVTTDCQAGLTCAAEGVCCDSGCTGECESCLGANTSAGSGNDGTCLPVSQGEDPKSGCGTGYVCDGIGRGDCASECAADTGMCDATVAVCADGFYCNDTGVMGMGACMAFVLDGTEPDLTCPDAERSQSCENVAYEEGGSWICCDGSCGGACESCFLAGSRGTCTVRGDGASGDPTCAPYLCNGSATTCSASCGDDSDCVSTHFCNTAFLCEAKLEDGTVAANPCTRDGMCESDVCADGFCCNVACDGACRSCAAADTGGSNGVCGTSSAMGEDDDGDPVSAALTCGNNGGPVGCGAGSCTCDGSGVCN
ncbi:MAG: hypothetical protein AAF654_01545 [Myxococcota bacterium]